MSLGAFSDHKKTSGKNVAPWAGRVYRGKRGSERTPRVVLESRTHPPLSMMPIMGRSHTNPAGVGQFLALRPPERHSSRAAARRLLRVHRAI